MNPIPSQNPLITSSGSGFISETQNVENNNFNSTIPIEPPTSASIFSETSCFEKMNTLKCKNPNNIACAYLNINSIRNKFNNFKDMFEKSLDIICIAETKLDSSFPSSNFVIPGFKSPYRKDVSEYSGGLLVFIKEHIPSKQLTKYFLPNDLQIIPIEINLRKTKWLLISIYRPHRTKDKYFLNKLSSLIDFYSSTYENILILGDFNMEIVDTSMAGFLESHCLKSLNKMPTCFKSKNGKCIDLMLTNKNRSFKYTNIFETGMSDFHLMIYTINV